MIIKQISKFLFKIYLFNNNGIEYTSYKNINFQVIEPLNLNILIDELGYFNIHQNINFISIISSTLGFQLKNNFQIETFNKILPENSTLLLGTTKQFICSYETNKWISNDPNVFYINNNGLGNALSIGKVEISCYENIKTFVTIIDIITLEIEKINIDFYLITPIYNEKLLLNTSILFPNDCEYKCYWDSNQCGDVETIINLSGIFCKINRNYPLKCPEYSKLTSTLICPNSKIYKFNFIKILYLPTINFGFNNDEIIELNPKTKKGFIPIKINKEFLKIKKSKYFTLSFLNDEGIIIRSIDSFNGLSNLIITYLPTNEKIKLNIFLNNTYIESNPIFHKKDFGFTQETILFIFLILITLLILIILFYLKIF